jgi:hypothetical protein
MFPMYNHPPFPYWDPLDGRNHQGPLKRLSKGLNGSVLIVVHILMFYVMTLGIDSWHIDFLSTSISCVQVKQEMSTSRGVTQSSWKSKDKKFKWLVIHSLKGNKQQPQSSILKVQHWYNKWHVNHIIHVPIDGSSLLWEKFIHGILLGPYHSKSSFKGPQFQLVFSL